MTDKLTCPDCGDPLEIDEAWELTDRSLLGTAATDLQGDYRHARCGGTDSHEEATE